MRLFGQVFLLVLVLIFCLVVGLAYLLAHQQTVREVEQQAAHDTHVLQHVKAIAQSHWQAKAQDPQHIATLQEMVEREMALFDDVTVIDVYTSSGQVLVSTDKSSVGERVPQSWLVGLQHDAVWRAESALQRQLGQRLEDVHGRLVGGVVVSLSKLPELPVLATAQHKVQMAMHWLLVWLLACAAAAGMLYVGIQWLLKPYVQARRCVEGAGVDAAWQAHPLVQAVAVRQQQRLQAQARWHAAGQALEALDHEA